MTTNPQKRFLIWFLSLFTLSLVYFGVGAPDILYSVFSFGHLQNAYTFSGNNPTSIGRYVLNQHKYSPFWISMVNILQSMTGYYEKWRYLVPGVAIIFPLILSFVKDLDFRIRWLTVVASVAGPIGIYGYLFVFDRGAVDVILMLSFLLLLKISHRDQRVKLFPVYTSFSFIIWLNHYTFWPFFAITAFIVLVFSQRREDAKTEYYYFSSLLIPFVIYPYAAVFYSTSLVALLGSLRRFFAFIQKLFSVFYFGQFRGNPETPIYVSIPSQPDPSWMPELLYLIYVFPLITISVVFLYTKYDNIKDLVFMKLSSISYQFLLVAAVVGGTTITGIIYFLRGYSYRIVILWPIVLSLIIWIVFENPPHPNIKRIKRIITISLALIVILHTIPVVVNQAYDQGQKPGTPSEQQIASVSTASLIENDRGVYTDLLHASLILKYTKHTQLRVGTGTVQSDRRIALTSEAAILYGYEDPPESSYIVITTSKMHGMRIWGAVIPLSSNLPHENKIYSNGQDSWYLSR